MTQEKEERKGKTYYLRGVYALADNKQTDGLRKMAESMLQIFFLFLFAINLSP